MKLSSDSKIQFQTHFLFSIIAMCAHFCRPQNQGETDTIAAYAKTLGLNDNKIWIGANDLAKNNAFMWSNAGSIGGSASWYSGEPNDHVSNVCQVFACMSDAHFQHD